MSNANLFSILLVEDDEVDVMNVRRAFQKSNITNPLLVAGNGLEALELLRAPRGPGAPHLPSLILLDLRMPKMSGIEFLRELRADPLLKKLIVVVLTTSDDEKDVCSAYDLNVAGYIVKPVTFDNFLHAVTTLNLYWTLSEIP